MSAALFPPAARRAAAPRRWRTARAFLRNRMAVLGALLLAAIIAMALLAPTLYPDDPLDMVGTPFLWPGQESAFPLGTDSLGRDVAAGIVHGARVSLLIGAWATLLGLVLGVTIGAVGGYFGGWIDDVALRLVELFHTIPPFLLVIVLVAIWEPSIRSITLAIGLVSSILMESALSFLGMGDANRVSWGSMIGNGREVLRTAWFLTAVPGAMIVVTVLALNLVSDGLNEALTPRLDRG